MRWQSVCVVVLVGASSTAAAQHARYPRQQPPPPSSVPSARLIPPPAPAPATQTAKPTIDADAVMSIESLRSAARNEQEVILAKLIENTPDSEAEEKSDYYFRLAELYVKQQRIYRIKAADEAKAVAAATTPQQKARAQANLSKALDQAKMYLLKAVKTYKGLTDNPAFRNYPRLDTALFYYAYVLQSGKYMKEARAVYDKLLKTFPASKYVPEAHLVFADYYFDQNQLADAEARYTEVLKFPRSGVYAYAHYKLGWVNLQLQRNQEAVASFHQAIEATRNDRAQAELHRAATADFARAEALIPSSARAACGRQHAVALALLKTPNASSASVLKAVNELVRIYKSEKKPDDLCRANTAIMTSDLADAYYGGWVQTQNADSLDYAEQLYAQHVALFTDAAQVRARYAEVLWARADREPNAKLRSERWTRAASVFATLQTPDAARAAALAWMNALDIVVADTKIVIGKPPRSRPRAQPLKGNDAKLVAAVAAYAREAGEGDDDLALMRLAAATVLRRNRHFDEAATVLDQFLAHHQDHAQAELAANLMLDSMIQARQLDEVVDVAAAIAADRDFVDGKQDLQNNLLLLRTRLQR